MVVMVQIKNEALTALQVKSSLFHTIHTNNKYWTFMYKEIKLEFT